MGRGFRVPWSASATTVDRLEAYRYTGAVLGGVATAILAVDGRAPGRGHGHGHGYCYGCSRGSCVPHHRPSGSPVTHWRPGDPASHHRRGRASVDWRGLRPRRWYAGGLPRSRYSRPHRAPRGSPVRHCAKGDANRRGDTCTMPDPAPRWGAVFTCPGRLLPLPSTGWKPIATQGPFWVV